MASPAILFALECSPVRLSLLFYVFKFWNNMSFCPLNKSGTNPVQKYYNNYVQGGEQGLAEALR
jgi:hypothetical protein